jgi:catechol 2,3-dioxygenase-like lactoylglutathione lyase family enzyme
MLTDRRAFPTIPASDLNRAKTWYRDKLGLAPTVEDPMGNFYALADGTGFVIYPTQFAGKAPNTLMSFGSKDVRGDVKTLRARGVVFEDYDFPGLKTEDGIARLGDSLGAWFKDSEGNILAIADTPY